MEKRPKQKILCESCSAEIKRNGIKTRGEGQKRGLCGRCLTKIYPGRGKKPVIMDVDGNLYFLDREKEKMIIFFNYGSEPYTSFTEVDVSDEQFAGCGELFLSQF